MEDVEGEAEQQPFSSNLHIAPKQKTPEIKIQLHIREVALGLNGTVHPKQTSLGRGDLCFQYPRMTGDSNTLHFFYDAQNKPAVVLFNGTAYAYL